MPYELAERSIEMIGNNISNKHRYQHAQLIRRTSTTLTQSLTTQIINQLTRAMFGQESHPTLATIHHHIQDSAEHTLQGNHSNEPQANPKPRTHDHGARL